MINRSNLLVYVREYERTRFSRPEHVSAHWRALPGSGRRRRAVPGPTASGATSSLL